MSDYSTRNISSPDTTISDKATLAGKVTDLNRLTDEHLTLVIDANVFMGAGTDPFKLYHDSDIVIPYAVIHTLDEHRSDGGGIGWACRWSWTTLNNCAFAISADSSDWVV